MNVGREDPQLKLRLSEELKHRVTEAARRNNRSVNAEIVSLLEDAFITEIYAENMEKLAIERQIKRRNDEAASVDARLTAIEGKLDQLLTEKGKK